MFSVAHREGDCNCTGFYRGKCAACVVLFVLVWLIFAHESCLEGSPAVRGEGRDVEMSEISIQFVYYSQTLIESYSSRLIFILQQCA